MADFDLTAEITAVLKEYTGDVMDKVSAAVEDCGKSMTKDIRQASPKRTGAYKKGWRCEIKRNGRGSTTATAKKRDKLPAYPPAGIPAQKARAQGHCAAEKAYSAGCG